MSTIKVNNLEGLNGTIIVPQGHNLEAYGSMVVNGQLVVPRWTEATKPTSNLVIGLIGYNTELGVSEVYTGTETEWVTVGKAVSKGLESSVGTLPFLHYQSEDLESVPSGAMTGSTAWINAGTAGQSYDLVRDTRGSTGTNPQRVTADGFAAVSFTGNAQLGFNGGQSFILENDSAQHNYTVAYVMKSAGMSYPSGSTSAPTICGNCYGPGTNPPDAVSGGAIGWQFGYWRTWYENDGGSPNNFPDSSGYGSFQQYIWTFSSGQVKGYKGATASPWVNQGWSTYGAKNYISGIGNARRHAGTYGWGVDGVCLDMLLYTDPLNDSQITALREYYADKYPVGSIAN
jgi:hypothetical protein